MMKPLITALVDTYNHERYIEQALVSVLEQGLSAAELEIVVVDDGSTDNTASNIQKFGPRVKHLRKKNGGQASALNAGYAESQGWFLKSKDYRWFSLRAEGHLKDLEEAAPDGNFVACPVERLEELGRFAQEGHQC
jgi:glycosyltransferase involved in cell wall biosynthesis